MASVKDSFLDLERHRKLLEQNVEKLRHSLQQWQLWNLEYEALKEEVTTLPKPIERADLARIRRDFDGQVVTKKEVDEIFGRIDLKPAEQIENVLSRRIDYSTKNVETLEKQLEAAENKLAAATVIAQPDYTHEDGEEVMDIVEQLDEDNNVVSYHVQRPGNIQPQLLEALKKAGIKDLSEIDKESRVTEEEDSEITQAPSSVAADDAGPSRDVIPEKIEGLASKKKGVSFADDTKPGHEDSENGTLEPQTRAARRLAQIMQTAKEQEDTTHPSSAILPEGESVEDATLRQEMLEYSMSEIGPVVAELSLEDGTDDDDDDFEFDYTDDEEGEDGYGRTNFHVDADYRERMLELQEKLGVKSTFTRGSVPDEGVGRISIVSQEAEQDTAPQQSSLKAGSKTSGEKKAVKFAESLDIAPNSVASLPERPKPQQTEPEEPLVEPLSDIVERTKRTSAPAEKSARKPSRFKSSRADNKDSSHLSEPGKSSAPSFKGPEEAPIRFLDQDKDERIAPSGPEGQTIADSVLERDTTEAREPDEMDATLLHQEAAVEYHRRRNRLIHSQGGFMKGDEPPTGPVEEDEEPKRVSRFKAARLSRQ